MTSNHQAFVKTFSRRTRTTGNQVVASPDPAAANVAPPVPNGIDIGSTPQITRVDPPQEVAQMPVNPAPISTAPISTAPISTAPINPAPISTAPTSTAPIAQAPMTPPPMTQTPLAATDANRPVARVAQQVAQQQRADSLQRAATTGTTPSAPVREIPSSAPTQTPATQTNHGPLTTERWDARTQGPPDPHHRIADLPEPAARDAQSAPPSDRTIEPFQAVWEVDVFDVPSRVADLFFDGRRYQQIAERMSAAVQTGLQSVLVTSAQSGEGRTSVAIGMAMAAAASGIRVALVDIDTHHPTLADTLRLDLQYGWVDTIRGGLPIKEIAVHAVEDGVTLIPLMPPHGQTAATAYEVTRLVDTLRNHFDLLITDGPPADSADALKIAGGFDSAVIVRDLTRTDAARVSAYATGLQEAGVQGVGVVENFI